MSTKRYQIFVSSTFKDLQNEREKVIKAILDVGHIPSGMEIFPASSKNQLELIKRIIDECDYYVVISAGKYGTTTSTGKSYTELEYEYALAKGIPVLGFIHKSPDTLQANQYESTSAGRNRLQAFHNSLKTRMCRFWLNADELAGQVMASLQHEMSTDTRPGWVRGTSTQGNYTRQDVPIPGWTQVCERLEAGDHPWLLTPDGIKIYRPSLTPTAYYIWNNKSTIAPTIISLKLTFLPHTMHHPKHPDFRIALFAESTNLNYNHGKYILCISPWESGRSRLDILRDGRADTAVEGIQTFMPEYNRVYTYRIEVTDRWIRITVDGQEVLRADYIQLPFLDPANVTKIPWYWGISTVGGHMVFNQS